MPLANDESVQPPNLTETFSNYSIYFLEQNNGFNVNCSVYSLNLGRLAFQEYFTEQWNYNVEGFFPAYYITNCSVKDVLNEIRSQNISEYDVSVWMKEFQSKFYSISDHGDLFVALLFCFSGLCVLAWMLMMMHILLPRHKQKPWLTVLATLVYSVVLTVILARITKTTEREYYKGYLDMLKVAAVLVEHRYPYALVVLHLLICLAYIQLLWEMVKATWRLRSTAFAATLVAACIVLSLVAIAVTPSPYGVIPAFVSKPLIASVSVSVVFIGWFCSCLIYHTFEAKAPLVSYTRRLLPLAIFTWIMILAREILCILLVTFWSSEWLVSSWLSYMPNVIDLYVLTCSWEWLYLIQQVEQKLELSGMLGRRISIDDVVNFNNEWSNSAAGGKYPSFIQWALMKLMATKKRTSIDRDQSNASNQLSASNRNLDSEGDIFENAKLENLSICQSESGVVVNLDDASICEVNHEGSSMWGSDLDREEDEEVVI